jgi:uncharacterized protein (DUF934 family)
MLESNADISEFSTSQDQFDRILVISRDFNDGRIFSLGRQLRLSGFVGQLTLVGELISDQRSALNACGFDDVITIDNLTDEFIVELKQNKGRENKCSSQIAQDFESDSKRIKGRIVSLCNP